MDLQAKKLDGQTVIFRIDASPDRCPQCHTSVHPKLLTQSLAIDSSSAYLTYLCTSHKCLRPFIATYARRYNSNDYFLRSTAPRSKVYSSFPELVSKLSPTFCEIYGQVEAAEAEGLNQLVGIGLRKSLEFLIKDFSKSEHPEEVENIEKMPLAQCIKKYVTDPNVLQCSQRAAWLGNDETHYIRKWSDKDVSDLQILVQLTVNWIHNHLLTKSYIDAMPNPS